MVDDRLENSQHPNIERCEHGRIPGCCLTCEYDADNELLRADVKRLEERLREVREYDKQCQRETAAAIKSDLGIRLDASREMVTLQTRAEKAEAEVERERERFEEARSLAHHARIKAAGLEEVVDAVRQVLTWGHTSVDDLRRDILTELGEE